MRSRAIVHGAVSIVNAIPTGVGAALGVDLTTVVEAELFESNRKELVVRINVEDDLVEDTMLVEKAVNKLLDSVGVEKVGVSLNIYSNIPIARGLKSSSAVSNAVVLAVSKLLGIEQDLLAATNIAVDASIESGVSITGAFDDAITCMIGGVNIADNYRRKILVHWDIEEDLRVLISLPEEKIHTGKLDRELFKNIEALSHRAVTLALNGLLWDAMIINGFVIASALNLDIKPMMAALKKNVLACGVSGKGPAIVAVTLPEYEEELEKEFRSFGRVIKAKPNNKPATVEVSSNAWEPPQLKKYAG